MARLRPPAGAVFDWYFVAGCVPDTFLFPLGLIRKLPVQLPLPFMSRRIKLDAHEIVVDLGLHQPFDMESQALADEDAGEAIAYPQIHGDALVERLQLAQVRL